MHRGVHTRTPTFCICPLLCSIDVALMDVLPLCSSLDSLKRMSVWAHARVCVCVCVCVSVSVKCCLVAFLPLQFSLSFSWTVSAGFFIQGTWSIRPFCLAINIDQRSSILSAPRQRPRVLCVRLPFLYHSPTNPQTALSLYEGIPAWPQGHPGGEACCAGVYVMGDWTGTSGWAWSALSHGPVFVCFCARTDTHTHTHTQV